MLLSSVAGIYSGNFFSYCLIFIMTILGSIASLFLKKASDSFKGDNIVLAVFSLIKTPSIYIGGFLYVTAAVLNIVVLKSLDYSIVLPLTSFTYVWTIFLAKLKFKEEISFNKVLGITLVIIGAVLVSRM